VDDVTLVTQENEPSHRLHF